MGAIVHYYPTSSLSLVLSVPSWRDAILFFFLFCVTFLSFSGSEGIVRKGKGEGHVFFNFAIHRQGDMHMSLVKYNFIGDSLLFYFQVCYPKKSRNKFLGLQLHHQFFSWCNWPSCWKVNGNSQGSFMTCYFYVVIPLWTICIEYFCSTQKKTKDPIQRKNPILFNNTIWSEIQRTHFGAWSYKYSKQTEN